ncbi:MAG TPA: FkbM family methyltransferase [Sphingobacteriaceae bacterium]
MKRKLPITSLLSPARVKALLSFGVKGYLADIGWFKAFDTKSAIDEKGNPIPWVTYSFIDFIGGRISKDHAVFEYGSGNSTWFYAKHAGKVVSVEHDKGWFNKIQSSKPDNSHMILCELQPDGDYSRMPVLSSQKFNIIIVDGRDRVNCCINCLPALADDGVIVLDDSEREQYQAAISFLIAQGFRHIPFSGISPGLFYRKSTSVFYKPNNCLGV